MHHNFLHELPADDVDDDDVPFQLDLFTETYLCFAFNSFVREHRKIAI